MMVRGTLVRLPAGLTPSGRASHKDLPDAPRQFHLSGRTYLV